jgi:putative ABC transport system substrate-binding protein
MDRRTLVTVALLGALAAPELLAQRSGPTRIGFLRILAPPRDYLEAFEQGLRERGYVLGRDVAVEYKFADSAAQLDQFAKELAQKNVAVLLAAGNQAIRAARDATRSIPIIMVVVADPVLSGFVASLGRPGGNITGTTHLSSSLVGKRLELLKQILPGVTRIGILSNKDNPAHGVAWTETLVAAKALGIDPRPFEVRGPGMLDETFARVVRDRIEALVVSEDAMFATERVRLATLAAKARVPTIYGQRDSVDDGGLMSYGPNIEGFYRSAAMLVDKILKGASPAELPIEQPTRFELVINMKTAQTLGISVPQSLLVRADAVIQ